MVERYERIVLVDKWTVRIVFNQVLVNPDPRQLAGYAVKLSP